MKKILGTEHYDNCTLVQRLQNGDNKVITEIANMVSNQGGHCKPHVGIDCEECHFASKTYDKN